MHSMSDKRAAPATFSSGFVGSMYGSMCFILKSGSLVDERVIRSYGSSSANPMMSNPHTRFAMVAGDFIVIDLLVILISYRLS